MRGYALRLRQLAEEGKSDDELRKEKEWMLEEVGILDTPSLISQFKL